MNIFHKYHFDKISEDEKIIKIVHRHWFNILQQYFFVFLALVLFFAGSLAFFFFLRASGASSLSSIFIFFLTTFAILFWLYAFLIWIDYYFDVWIITSERVINIEQKGFFSRQVSELNISKIQDVTTEVRGFLQTVINFGDVHIQTAAEEGKFIFRQIPDPYHLKTLLMDLLRQKEKKKGELIH